MNIGDKIKDYGSISKFRLSFSVIISAWAGYLFMGGGSFLDTIYLLVGGILVTGSSNASNQIWERNLDAKMSRTSHRPIASGKMSVKEAVITIAVALTIGFWMLYQLNFNAMILGMIAYTSYTFVYTPSKRVTPWAVVIGAFPGAIPPMIGVVAADPEGRFTAIAGALFFVQFVWQLPHFWAIAWVAHDDYQKAGFFLLPSRTGRSKTSAFRIALSCLILIPFSLFPWAMDIEGLGLFTLMMASIFGLIFFLYSYKLYLTLEIKDAKVLMFASFFYLPLVQFTYVIDKFLFH
ncbi:MAG: protoheme IX farnesyltransferase [Brumimicrobium sp.]|nr:protoheme IX farnesyltransferase [Brumimicrobium sp.]MCO5267778.1 heme o synthase [Brumimicrobium sp.]